MIWKVFGVFWITEWRLGTESALSGGSAISQPCPVLMIPIKQMDPQWGAFSIQKVVEMAPPDQPTRLSHKYEKMA